MKIKWLHLSDIHFNYKNYASDSLRDDFIGQIKALSKSEPFTHLFLTGDILFKNEQATSETADFLKRLIDSMSLPLDRVFVVPGNHDHDRNHTVSLINHIEKKNPEIPFGQMIDSLTSAQTKRLLSTFQNYDSVYSDLFGQDYYAKSSPHILSYDESCNCTIIRINTAWLDQNSEDNQTLYCGSKQLQDLLHQNAELLSKTTNIAIGHHSLNALHPDEKNRVIDQLVRNNIGLYFCGHAHRPSIEYFHDKDIIQILAPGGFNDGYSEGGYVWGILDTDLDFYKSETFNWNNGNWAIDSRLEGTNERGIFYFNSNKYKHNSDIVAVDLKLFDGHLSRTVIENTLLCQVDDIHTHIERDMYNWHENEDAILELSNDIKYLKEQGKQVHIFPMAPIPTLLKLGYELQNNTELFIHQHDRNTYKWVLNGQEDIKIDYFGSGQKSPVLAVSISTSNDVDPNLIKQSLGDTQYDTLSFRASIINFGLPLYSDTVKSFSEAIGETLRSYATRYSDIHVFAAVPAGLAIEIGRRILKSAFGAIHTYNFSSGKYSPAYILSQNVASNPTVKDDTNGFDASIVEAQIVFLPVVGQIPCGNLSEAIAQPEELFPFPASYLDATPHFLLRAHGESMIEAGINDGDLLVIRQQNAAEEGQIVVARIGDEATLKKIHYDSERGKYILRPANHKFEDMEFDQIDIQGIAIKVIKNL
ncbi:MAG: SAVED domain-containing protein [Ruminococcaceae bacterium]|nr:SAVED domain-containing protein [Oscillospiraceae bacterium]